MFTKFLSTAVLVLAASTANANVVLNGDFETGAFTNWTATGNASVSGPVAGAFYFGGGSAEQNGDYLVAFNGGQSTPDAFVSQTFGTSQGTEYAISFDFGATSNGNQTILAQILGANGSVLSSFNVTGINAPAELQTFRFSFVADGNFSTLKFSDLHANDSFNQDGLLDNVSVSAVPEPASVALMGFGMLGLVASRRRAQKSKNA